MTTEEIISQAREYSSCGEYDWAILQLYEALNGKTTVEQEISIRKLLCLCYRKQENYSAALLQINTAIRVNAKRDYTPDVVEEKAICQMNKGIVYEAAGDFSKALTCFIPATNTIISLHKDSPESYGMIINALITLGACYERCGELQNAVDTLNKCYDYFTGSPDNDRRYIAVNNTISDLRQKIDKSEKISLLPSKNI